MMPHGRIKPADLPFKINNELPPDTVLLYGLSSDLQKVTQWGWIEVDSLATLEKYLNTINARVRRRRMTDAQFLKACGISGGTTVA